MSLAEAAANMVFGYVLAVALQLIAFPLLGIEVSVGGHLGLAALFTAASLARNYAIRRCFEALRQQIEDTRATWL